MEKLAHKDSLGHVDLSLKAGEVQLMHAGTGNHSQRIQPSTSNPVHFVTNLDLQIDKK